MKTVFLITAITGLALTTGCSVMSEAFNEGVNQADYTEAMKASYTKNCGTEAEKNATPDEARKYCECTFERISSTVPVGEFVKFDNGEAVKEETTTAFKVAITQCGGNSSGF